MAWYEFVLLCFFLFAFLALSFVLLYWEIRKYKKAILMLEEQKEFYFWGKQFFYRREMEYQDYENVT